jgi:hypothetical protein
MFIRLFSCPCPLRFAAPPPPLVRLPPPDVLKAIREGLAARARRIGASDADKQRAIHLALREWRRGRSTAVAIALAAGKLSGRRNPLLQPQPTAPGAA